MKFASRRVLNRIIICRAVCANRQVISTIDAPPIPIVITEYGLECSNIDLAVSNDLGYKGLRACVRCRCEGSVLWVEPAGCLLRSFFCTPVIVGIRMKR